MLGGNGEATTSIYPLVTLSKLFFVYIFHGQTSNFDNDGDARVRPSHRGDEGVWGYGERLQGGDIRDSFWIRFARSGSQGEQGDREAHGRTVQEEMMERRNRCYVSGISSVKKPRSKL